MLKNCSVRKPFARNASDFPGPDEKEDLKKMPNNNDLINNSSHRKFFGNWLYRAVMLLSIMLCILSGTVSGSEKKARKVVRIAYQEFNRQMIVDENNVPVSGYAYDYIQTIGSYAGWDIRFVPCSSFFDSVKLIRAGKVDLIYEISYTKERAKEFLFPNEPMGHEYYYLYASENNTTIASGDYASMNGRKVGVTKGTILADLLKDWSKKKKVDFKLVEYEDISKKEADLYAGKIDLDLELSMLAKRNLSAVEKIGSSAYYLVASKKRPDLIDDINSATEKIHNNDLFYFSRLQERYFSDTVLSRNLTFEEKNWLAEHKVLRIGFYDDYLPFCAADEQGKPIGALIDAVYAIVRQLKLTSKLKVKFICYDNQEEGFLAVESGEIDIMLPAYISNSVKKDYRIIGSKPLATLVSDFTYLSDYWKSKQKRIGVNKYNLMQYYYSKDSYPEAQIIFYNDIRSCLDGLLKGTSDGTLLNSLRTDALLNPRKYRPLSTMRAKHDFQFCMAFAKDNLGLMLLMNRGLTMLDPEFINKASYSYVGRIYNVTMLDFLQEHILKVIILVAVLLSLIGALIGFRISNRKLFKINRKLTAYSKTIENQKQQETELRKQLEKQQEELKDALSMAQSASRAKTTFLSNMSHDIRTPMNAIIGFTGLAASHIDEKERVREYLSTISRSSEHLLALINDILDMSRIEAGKTTLKENEESLADILHSLRDIVHADMQAKHHNFDISAVGVRNETVYCDKMRLNQILLNLVSNSIKYTHQGGTISLRLVQKSAAGEGAATFEFRCRDNGIGMSEEYLKTIFEPFTREENSTVSGIQGTGLGMAITKNVVDMMGGIISVDSKKGEGTEFVVLLDLKLSKKDISDPVIPELKGKRSLVVNHDAAVSQDLSDMLREAGMISECCVSADKALSRTEEARGAGEPFDLFVVDMQMPGIDGIETVRRIRKSAGKEASVILTAYDWADIEKEAREAGVNEFLSNPVFRSDMHGKLLHLCGKETPVQTAGEEQNISFKGKKVLMVDDSKLNLKIGVLLLQEQGMIVDTASNGQMAVDKIRDNGADAYDFVLMDVQMPVMGGYEATSAIRKLPDGNKVKIIAFSANAFEEDREKSLKAGMNGHIAKPLKINELLSELKRLVV